MDGAGELLHSELLRREKATVSGYDLVLAVFTFERTDEQGTEYTAFTYALGQLDHAFVFDHLVRMILERNKVFDLNDE